jgi:predicted Zn-dependent peptidase
MKLPFRCLLGFWGRGMSSRLFIRLREEMGAGYYVSADVMEADDTGLIWCCNRN